MGKEVLHKKTHVIDSGIDIENARDEKNIPEFDDKLVNKSSDKNTTRYVKPIVYVTFVAILSALVVSILLLLPFSGGITSCFSSVDVKFVTVDSGYYSGIDETITEVFRSTADFESFWARHTANLSPPPEVPGIDFQKEMVIAVFRGTQISSGFGVEVTHIVENIIKQNTEIVVKYETRDPSPDEDVMSVMTQPFHIVKVQSSTKGVSFEGSDISRKDSSDVKFTAVDSGYYSAIEEPLTEVFHSNEDFESFWAMHTSNLSPPPEVPEIDFQKEMVIAVFRGTQKTSGYDVNIRDIVDNDDGMVVTYETKDPCPGSTTAMVLTQPFHIIQVLLSTKSVIFGGNPIDC